MTPEEKIKEKEAVEYAESSTKRWEEITAMRNGQAFAFRNDLNKIFIKSQRGRFGVIFFSLESGSITYPNEVLDFSKPLDEQIRLCDLMPHFFEV